VAGKIFINYRRDDGAAHALNISQYLERAFGSRNVFIDIDRVRAGQKFPEVLERRLAKCKVMVAVIGPNWLDARDDSGRRRLDEPADWVRLEIVRALARNITVMPVTVGRAPRHNGWLPPNALTSSVQLGIWENASSHYSSCRLPKNSMRRPRPGSTGYAARIKVSTSNPA
jgi:TIR domain